ncbi:MAG: replicative DNA helicase [candidate division Zixibacteria bacterium]|nr:replicative DNA helicase [candidate division Zixibacteria bacterium]MDD5425499.1 replicative DNA helicase [candidate division Zixibacteria bacterium]
MAYRTQTGKDLKELQPPQAIDAEQEVLGSILKDNDAINQAIEILDSETHFYLPKHQIIYRTIINLYNNSDPCDITTVADDLLKQGNLEKIGGRVYLVELVEKVVSTAHIVAHANIVLERSVLRRLIQTSNEIVQSCYTLDQPVDYLLDLAETNIFNISESRLRKGFVPIKGLITQTFEQIETFQSGDRILDGIMTDFTALDVMTQGLHNGDLIIVAGRPSMGKSAFAMNIAENVAIRQKKGVGIFSIEMSKEQLTLRLLCSRAKISQQKIRSRKLNDEEWGRLTRAGGSISPMNIFIDDSPTLTSLEMRAKARRLKAQFDISLIIVDYIQMMQASGHQENRQQEIAVISRNLKALAKELNIPVIAISQLSRMVEQRGGEKRPQLSDLRESGAIEQDADVVMFVYRPEFYMSHLDRNDPKYLEVEGKAEIIVAKQRNGPTGVANLVFIKEFARFENPVEGYRELPSSAEPMDDQDLPF